MKSYLLLALVAMTVTASAFVSPSTTRAKTSLFMTMDQAPPATILAPAASQSITTSASSSLNNGVGKFLVQDSESTILTSSNVLSLKDRPPPPTPEEIAAKKRTFNLWFWGGGFVAPFLATFYYFGFKFWER
mmetsp:Transcript_8489/g.16891  ORF Transcript_8489/g.16891 Transcript_8489/m.16891 type:complete len:132 (+) Transcript_8489:99-494(+)